MHRNITGKLLPVTMVGSYPRPRWYKRELHGMDFREAWLSVDWYEEWTDALKGCLADQQAAGLDIVTDGELYDYDVGGSQWPLYTLERIGGVYGNPRRSFRLTMAGNMQATSNDILKEMFQRITPPIVTEKITRGPWRFAEINRLARTYAERPVKCSFIDPQFAASMLENRFYAPAAGLPIPPELTLDLCRAINEELRELEQSGCQIYQCDWPPFAFLGVQNAPREAWDFAIDAFNQMVEGIGSSMQIWQHYCWGNPAGQLIMGFAPSFRPMMERVFETRFDVLNVEIFHDEGAEIDLLAQVPKDRGVALGLINHRSTVVEDPKDLAALVRKALVHVEPDRLYLTTGCGLMHQPRQNAFFKLKALADAARIVREELTGQKEDTGARTAQAVAT